MATKVKDLQTYLSDVNPEAEVQVVVNNYPVEFSLTIGSIGSKDGCTKENCDTLSFYVDSLCTNERK